jgi:protoporphyrinogen oxidase
MEKQTLILGGGLAGLSACLHSSGIVCEQHETPGGHSRSHTRDGLTFDEGIYVLHTNSDYELQLLNEANAGLDVKEREA